MSISLQQLDLHKTRALLKKFRKPPCLLSQTTVSVMAFENPGSESQQPLTPWV